MDEFDVFLDPGECLLIFIIILSMLWFGDWVVFTFLSLFVCASCTKNCHAKSCQGSYGNGTPPVYFYHSPGCFQLGDKSSATYLQVKTASKECCCWWCPATNPQFWELSISMSSVRCSKLLQFKNYVLFCGWLVRHPSDHQKEYQPDKFEHVRGYT